MSYFHNRKITESLQKNKAYKKLGKEGFAKLLEKELHEMLIKSWSGK